MLLIYFRIRRIRCEILFYLLTNFNLLFFSSRIATRYAFYFAKKKISKPKTNEKKNFGMQIEKWFRSFFFFFLILLPHAFHLSLLSWSKRKHDTICHMKNASFFYVLLFFFFYLHRMLSRIFSHFQQSERRRNVLFAEERKKKKTFLFLLLVNKWTDEHLFSTDICIKLNAA